ncbi:MAG: hypothetical protein WD963_00640 [Candidatus Paceibacterota bacterium]
MPSSDRNKLNRIEELKSQLSSKNYQTKIGHRDSFAHANRQDIPETWQDGQTSPRLLTFKDKLFMKRSLFKNFFLASLVFLLLTVGYASFIFFAGGNTVSNDNIEISIIGNNFTAGGEELSLIIGITNRNSSALDLVDLVIEYPRNSSTEDSDSSVGTERSRISLGTIPAGAIRNENLKVVLFGQQGTIRPIKISLEYRVEGSNAIFVKEQLYEVTISSTPLNLSIDAPFSISPNQEITLNVKAILNATQPVSQILVKLDYPPGFQFQSSNPVPSLNNNVWNLGDFAPGAERNISILGKMIDVFDGEEKSFHVSSGLQSNKDRNMIGVVFNSLVHTIAIQKPFIEAQLLVNGAHQREYAVDSKTPIRGQIEWSNNLDNKINDLEIRAKISGNAVNRNTINAERGFYNSSEDVIIWDKNSFNGFNEINPGESGSVNFSVSPLALVSAVGGIILNPSVTIDISISGKQLVASFENRDLINSDSGIVRIISDLGFTAKALHYSGPFTNTGSVPPKAETETTYTIVWSLSNTANNISKSVLRSSLPSWMRFMDVVSPNDGSLTYNSSTREIVWDIGAIPKGTSITQPKKEVSFQVALTPSLSQVGTIPIIVYESLLTGYDDFAKVNVKLSKPPLRTQLISDPLFPSSGAMVVE